MKNIHIPYEYLYIIVDPQSGAAKIGRSLNPRERLDQLQTSNPHTLLLFHIFPFLGYIEPYLHKFLQKMHPDLHIQGEWYKLSAPLLEEVYRYMYHELFDFLEDQYTSMDIDFPDDAMGAIDILWEYLFSCPQIKNPKETKITVSNLALPGGPIN